MKSFFKFLASKNGRIIRIVIGAVLVLLGIFVNMNRAGAIILIVVGLIPLLAGIFDVCVFAPLFGRPISGKKLRAE
jgi:uncharacterized membrane protein HdeD (DUF308 family)